FAGMAAVGAAAGLGFWLTARRRRNEEEGGGIAERELLNHATQAVVSARRDGTISTFSRGAEALFGIAAAEISGRTTLRELLAGRPPAGSTTGATDPDGRDIEHHLAAAIESGHHEWAGTLGRRDGRPFAARVSLTALRDEQSETIGFLAIVSDLTELQAAEERRREFDARHAKIASQVSGVVYQFMRKPDGRTCFPYASDGLQEMFGVEPSSAALDAATIWGRVHPDDQARVNAAVEESGRTLTRWQCEFRVRSSSGDVRWLLGNSMPERLADGAIVWHGFVTDITERKQAEVAHEENRAVLQSILESVDLGVFLVDVLPDGDFRFVEVNAAYERLTGIAAAEIRGRTPRELVPVIPMEMAVCLRASLRRAVDTGASVEYEEPFFARGRLLWWLTRLTPQRDATGRIVRLVGRSLDITERKAVEQRVQSLTERLQLATEAAQVGIWDHDVAQNKLVWDQRMLALYGLTPATFDGTFAAWRDRVHPEDRLRAEQEYRDAIETRKPYQTSLRIVRPDGDEREIRVRVHVQRNPAGRAVRVVGVHWDVTAERRAQAEIELARDQAEDLNRQLEDALERAHRLAQEAAAATVAKSEFLANMSHEIRTPLNAIIGMSGLLLGTELGRDQREFAETIRLSGDGLLALVNDILDYSKIESGRLELEQRTFDLRECVEGSIDVLSSRAAEKKLDLVYMIDPAVPEAIEGDAMRLRQVVVNLLSNAVKFTERGEVMLAVSTVPAQDTGRTRLRFAVHDSGIGIPPERMDRLFKTFSQVDTSTTRQYGGTGLGLAISKRIVEVMGGKIWVESTPGKGSSFCFEIETRPMPAPTKPFAAGRVPVLTGRRILIVDDSATCCRALCQQAVAWGLVPRAASLPDEVEALLQRGEPFDALLVDFDLGGASALVLLEAVRKLRPAAQLPIGIMVTPGQARVPETLGVAGSINKPLKTAALYRLLCDMLDGQVTKPSSPVDHLAGTAAERPLHILLAEDNPVNQRVAILMLQRMGYRADVVANGRDAVAAAERLPYDLILMDVQMPEMDGLQASKEICNRMGPERRPRIVAMTANASIGDRERCLRAGMDDYLSKPVRVEDLRKALEDTPIHAAASVP
ncbi:MAG TPA: PAS domain S-box protein, partial [Opitutaceae bacterium]|nr:PAS domain S-box protein [Opitutaceae bacterium]